MANEEEKIFICDSENELSEVTTTEKIKFITTSCCLENTISITDRIKMISKDANNNSAEEKSFFLSIEIDGMFHGSLAASSPPAVLSNNVVSEPAEARKRCRLCVGAGKNNKHSNVCDICKTIVCRIHCQKFVYCSSCKK